MSIMARVSLLSSLLDGLRDVSTEKQADKLCKVVAEHGHVAALVGKRSRPLELTQRLLSRVRGIDVHLAHDNMKCINTFGWTSLPSHILRLLARYKLIELGAGNGYLAWRIKQFGGDVVAFDNCTTSWQRHWADGQWFDVQLGDENQLAKYPDRSLLMAHPTFNNGMAMSALRKYTGRTLYLVSNSDTDCEAKQAFFAELKAGWKLTAFEPLEYPAWAEDVSRFQIYYRR